jgi:hypothetical protein
MSERSDAFRRRAEECDAAAARVSDSDICDVYLDIAGRWRKMAEQQDAIDQALEDRRPAIL